MTETQKHQLDELSVTDILSYLVARVFSMGEYIRRQDTQLNKAKELLKSAQLFLPSGYNDMGNSDFLYELKEEIEQLLKK